MAGGWGLRPGGREEGGSRKFSWLSDVNPGEPGSIRDEQSLTKSSLFKLLGIIRIFVLPIFRTQYKIQEAA